MVNALIFLGVSLAGLAPMSEQKQSMPATAEAVPPAAPMNEDMMVDDDLVLPGLMVGRAGAWMIGYEAMFDRMNGNRVGTRAISEGEILDDFMAAPTKMRMQMHMLMGMYAPTDNLTLSAAIPYVVKTMDHDMQGGGGFIEKTRGIGDVELGALYSLARQGAHRLVLNVGVGLPTGSIDQDMDGARLEYPMQLGSGTVSISPGLTYVGAAGPWGWATEFVPTFQLGKNRLGYSLGDRYRLSLWGARRLTGWLTISGRANLERWGNIRGSDPVLDIEDEPTKDPGRQGGRRVELLAGANLHPMAGPLAGHQFLLEIGTPVYQSLNGPQLERDWVASLAWRRAF